MEYTAVNRMREEQTSINLISIFIQISALINVGTCDSHSNVQIRLVNGTVANQGRLEVFYNNTWGTVCDDNFDVDDARVVCRMLGIQTNSSIPIDKAYFGEGLGPILLDEVQCIGTELNIEHCNNSGWYENDCKHGEDVGVICDEAAAAVFARLVNSDMSPNRGRLEVFFNGTWGTVCDDSFDERDSRVVCRMLGLVTNYSRLDYFGEGTGPILLDDVNCTGLETNIGECSSGGWNISNCRHNEDVGVICFSDDDADVLIRLVNGSHWSSAYSGRLEVFYNNTWGTVCDDSFDVHDAQVVCRMLGLSTNYSVLAHESEFGEGAGPILLDDVNCIGSEPNIAFCKHRGWYVNNCQHREDVGVYCYSDTDVNTTVQVRLVNGSSATSGRLEVFFMNMWGTICDDYFNVNDATVVCRMLGFHTNAPRWVPGGTFGTGSGQIMLDSLQCLGTETSIDQCSHNQWFQNDCSHREDVGVICDAIEVKIRLVNGSSSSNGRVEVFYNNTWGTVCDDNFDANDAEVVCRMLGVFHNNSVYPLSNSFFGQGSGPVLLDNLQCIGSEVNLAQCDSNGWYTNNCGHDEDAGVICNLGSFAQDNRQNVRYALVDGPNQYEGRLEINVGGIWGTVCGNDFDDTAATVVCHKLGIQNVQGRKLNLEAGSGPIWLDHVKCQGNERSLSECSHGGWGVNNCEHSQDVGVYCGTATDVKVRLVNGSSSSNGRLEVFHDNIWGTVCDNLFDTNDVTVVCRMLGMLNTTDILAVSGNVFGHGTGPILLDALECLGSEWSLAQCPSSGWYKNTCGHVDDSGVICDLGSFVKASHQRVQYRLVGGHNQHEGRLEVNIGGLWGTVCDDNFDNNAAKVVCNNLGIHLVEARMASFAAGSGPIWLDNVLCQGNEHSLAECSHSEWGVNNCQHSEDVGVICGTSSTIIG